jgi:hypothetical protein
MKQGMKGSGESMKVPGGTPLVPLAGSLLHVGGHDDVLVTGGGDEDVGGAWQ